MNPPDELEIDVIELDGESLMLLSWPKARRSGAAKPIPPTPAEEEVLRALLRGATNSEIARERGTAERTVANQVQALFKKFGVTSRHQLVAKVSLR